MSFSTPLFCVSLISLYSALRVLNLMKLLHPRNLRYKTGLTIVRLVSSLPVTVHIPQFLLGLWTILTLTFTYLRSACSLPPTSAIMKTLPLKHADTNVISLLLPFYESFLLIQSCLVTDFPTLHLPVLHLRLYHVPPSPHLLPSSLPDLSNRPQGQHNLPTRRKLRPLVHNTLLLQVLALTPNDPAYPAKAAPPQVDPLDTCPSFPTTPDPWDPPPLPLIVPAVVRIIKVKVLIKVHLKAKTNFPPIGHLSALVPLKALQRTLLGPPPKVLPRVPIKASLTAKVSLHLPYTHLLPTPHLMVIHKTFFHLISLPSLPLLPVWAYCPARSQDLLPSSIPNLVIPLTLILPFPIRRCRPLSSFFTHVVLSSPRIPPSRYALASLLYTNSTPFCLLSSSIILPFLPPLRGQPGHIVRLVALTSFCPRFSFSLSLSLSLSLFLPNLSSPTPAFPSASPLLRPCCLSRCLPKVARPNVAAPFVDITQSGCLPPCRTPLAVCRLCSSAIIARCYYVPPTILVPPMLVDAVDHLARYCLLALSLPLQV